MAIPTNHIDKITDHDSGESRPICPPAEHVSVDNENYEGETLDEVLDEMAKAIEEAGQGGYAPPQGGIPKTDLAQSVQDSLDKADSALQDDDVAEVAKTGDYNDLEHKPAIPDTSNLATKTELNAKQDTLVAGNGIVIAQDGKTVSVDAEVVQPVTADGTFAVRIGNNEYTINLNHEHPQYQPLLTAGSNITITTDPQTGEVTISAAGGGGGSVTIDPSITGANQANPVAGGAIYTALQGKANASEMSIDAVSGDSTKMTIQLKSGVAQNVVTQHQSLAGRVQSQDVVSIVKISQSAYDALQTKDSTTLYLITES
jgi:hypothetical protein